jgi:nucleotide-binding universal stress UspA family protein
MPSQPTDAATITVGCDLTNRSNAAVAWAAAEARRWGARLRLVTVWHAGVGSHEVIPPAAQREALTREALEGVGDGVDAEVVGLEGRAGPMLVQSALDSMLLVVGSAGHVGALGALSGSVTRYCLRHAMCPVAVVGPGALPGPLERVLVSGTLDPDGSSFAWALEHARRAHADLHLLDSWYAEPIVPSYPELDRQLRQQSRQRHALMYAQLARLAAGTVRVTESLVSGHVRDVLQARTQARDLLVLPSAALHHISFVHRRCPVVVLPPVQALPQPSPAAASPGVATTGPAPSRMPVTTG